MYAQWFKTIRNKTLQKAIKYYIKSICIQNVTVIKKVGLFQVKLSAMKNSFDD